MSDPDLCRRRPSRFARLGLSVGLACACAAVASPVRAERLTLKVYTTADGLPHNTINRVVPDSRGFLWFCTGDGLSRFDGYTFTNYSVGQGLPSAIVTDLLETRAGVYWIGTDAGLVRLNPLGTSRPPSGSTQAPSSSGDASTPMFTTYVPDGPPRARYITSLFEDRAGNLWVGTLQGLYRVAVPVEGRVGFSFVDVDGLGVTRAPLITRLIQDRRGVVWIGGERGLFRRSPDGRVDILSGFAFTGFVQDLLEDRAGTIWAATRDRGLAEITIDQTSGAPARVRVYDMSEGFATNWITALVQTRDGTLWIGSNRGLIQRVPAAGGVWRFRVYAAAQGVSGEVWSLAEDADRTLWLGRALTGVARLRYRHISTFDASDGLGWASHPIETRQGEIVTIGGVDTTQLSLNRFDGETFRALGWLGGGKVSQGWGWHQTLLQDRTGDWWIATNDGVFRYAGHRRIDELPRVAPTTVFTTRDGLSSNSALCVFEDSRGDVWIATAAPPANGLSRWQRSTGTLTHYARTLLTPPHDRVYVSSIAEDRAGHVWFGFSGLGGLARLDGDRITRFAASDGVPAGRISNLRLDAAGRLWLGTDRAGIARIDQPTAATPTFVAYSTAQGLSSNEAQGIGEDRSGLIYIGTGRGIDRLNPVTGRFTHYSSADGVVAGAQSVLRDRHGAMWFGSSIGLARLVPEPDPPSIPPPILITGVRLGARPLAISAIGERDVRPIVMPDGNHQLQVDFVAPGSTPR